MGVESGGGEVGLLNIGVLLTCWKLNDDSTLK